MKWNEAQIPLKDVLKAISYQPLFGNKRSKTHYGIHQHNVDASRTSKRNDNSRNRSGTESKNKIDKFNGGNTMEKDFYIGQPLIDKETGERVVLYYNDGECIAPYNVLGDSGEHCRGYHDLEPSTEFKFSEIIAGLEQGYFDVGTEFESNNCATLIVDRAQLGGLGLKQQEWSSVVTADISASSINTVWTLVDHRKKMTLEEIEAELGVQNQTELKNKIDNM